MTQIFLNIVQISIQVSFLILAVLLLRLFVRNFSRRLVCFLWLVVGIRLLIPISFESRFGILPDILNMEQTKTTENVSKHSDVSDNPYDVSSENLTANATDSGLSSQAMSNSTSDSSSASAKSPSDSANSSSRTATTSATSAQVRSDFVSHLTSAASKQTFGGSNYFLTASYIWLAGFLALLTYMIIKYIQIARKVRISIDNGSGVRICDNINSPFVLFGFPSRIYLPSDLNTETVSSVIAHEKTHIRHLDHVKKLLAFFVLAVYWFHPLVILSYFLYCKDMEIACDEAVISKMSKQEKKAYSNALLLCSLDKNTYSATLLAFGEISVKERIGAIMKYKKRNFSTLSLLLILSIAVMCCCIACGTKQKRKKQTVTNSNEIVLGERIPKEKVMINFDAPDGTGADGAQLLYTDKEKLILYTNLGLFVYDKSTHEISQSISLPVLGCNYTQGDFAYSMHATKDGTKVYMEAPDITDSEYMNDLGLLAPPQSFVYDVENNALYTYTGELDYEDMSPAAKENPETDTYSYTLSSTDGSNITTNFYGVTRYQDLVYTDNTDDTPYYIFPLEKSTKNTSYDFYFAPDSNSVNDGIEHRGQMCLLYTDRHKLILYSPSDTRLHIYNKDSHSMEHTLQPGEDIQIDESYRVRATRNGQYVYFLAPVSVDSDSESKSNYVYDVKSTLMTVLTESVDETLLNPYSYQSLLTSDNTGYTEIDTHSMDAFNYTDSFDGERHLLYPDVISG